MNIEEHNQRRPVVKRATLQQAHHSNTTMDDQSSDNTQTETVTDPKTDDMGAQTSPTIADAGEDEETVRRVARRPRDEEESQYENEHARKKAMEYHDTKTEGAFFISSKSKGIDGCITCADTRTVFFILHMTISQDFFQLTMSHFAFLIQYSYI